jgi:hypothetical protein
MHTAQAAAWAAWVEWICNRLRSRFVSQESPAQAGLSFFVLNGLRRPVTRYRVLARESSSRRDEKSSGEMRALFLIDRATQELDSNHVSSR